jgi:hypothetical protein
VTRKIRDDFVGVVHLDGRVLKAGDEEPEGVTLGDHLFEKGSAEAESHEDKPAAPARQRRK